MLFFAARDDIFCERGAAEVTKKLVKGAKALPRGANKTF
jgi:hypothetical protein